MFDFFQQINFLEDLSFVEVILHVLLFDGLDSYVFASELVHTQCYLAERTFANELNELIKL